jgi:hypothetical protein
MERISGEEIEMEKCHSIENISFKSGKLNLMVDGKSLEFDRGSISGLAGASEEKLHNCEISPSGYRLHWPLIDADISIDGLLGIIHTNNATTASVAAKPRRL